MPNWESVIVKFSKQELVEIYDVLNKWGWDDRLGDKLSNWDELVSYSLDKHVPSKYNIIMPIIKCIESRVSQKALLKYHHLKNCGMSRLQHEIWWIRNSNWLEKLLRIGR